MVETPKRKANNDTKTLFQLEQLKKVKWMNQKAGEDEAYVPTRAEHIANVVSNGVWIPPAVSAILDLFHLSSTWPKLVSTLVYGSSMFLILIVSTAFHYVFYKGRFTTLKNILHRCDRAMIYVFIIGTYYPWLNSENFHTFARLHSIRLFLWCSTAVGIVYQQMFHEKHKSLSTIFYITAGLLPLIAILKTEEYSEVSELTIGALFYAIGVLFFKMDGTIPCAHAIWHTCASLGAMHHYNGMMRHLYLGSKFTAQSEF